MPRKKLNKSYPLETTGIRLSSHEKLCAERMKSIQDSIKELNKEVKYLRQDVSKGKGAVSLLIFVATIIVAISGVFYIK
jgi:hypothetical protein|tara:strand:+ start:43 stop:279 length:237 start_codon:yes stop_codon:yes gene_type:complete